MASSNVTTTWRRVGALALSILPLVVTGSVVLWTLHHPKPRVLAPVVIDRNSLLPHQYAGPCMNCHLIREVGPVAINSTNMSKFSLSAVDRQLLAAGQRVDVPDLRQKISIPAITRNDGLPHPYVGVCSNCHVVLDVHPTPAFMQEAMRRASRPLAGLNLPPGATAFGGAAPDRDRARYRILLGYGALPLMIATILSIGLRALAKAGAWALGAHQWLGAAFCAATALHWYFSDRGNNFLHLALVTLSLLATGGLLLKLRASRRRRVDGGLLLYAQRLALVVLIALVLIGHFFSRFD